MMYMVVQRLKNVCVKPERPANTIVSIRYNNNMVNAQCVALTICPVAGNQKVHELAEVAST